ncbi:ECF RNA polymerase sigma factor SigE [Gemmata sp. SH-PL17]|uniref:sigma-70 family RNA polymerase sigma factor n=1 Tax=Gemmata sp. SH-PL17 TaxID=1630693 RepID=UPI00078D5710|nr:sigma-70 family RNA polymerase sigma factor [Gemmata sp. SH-PL17]AMV27757.1 ECF RNA polymerase sigma factor SigE [Gemmata sp. SH-PL17]
MSGARLIHLARDIALHNEGAPSDTELLQRFTADRDEAAFTELVRRNGSLVLRTCRHVLGESAADDAFQAVFLLLVRSAHRLTRPGSLAGWLHAAAVRIAQRARRGEDRRRKREAARRVPPSAPDDLTWKEVREVLDAEIAALPENYRLPLVLCYLQELTHEEAAQRIGCEPGVLRGRLDRGRERLRRRLARYGLPLTVPALVVGTPQPVPAALVESTVRVVSVSVSAGAPPVLAALIGRSTRWRAVLLAPAVTVLAFVLAAAGQPVESPPAPAPAPRVAQPVAKAAPVPTTDAFGDPLPPGAVARLGSIRFHHGETIDRLIVGADGKLVASYGRTGLKLWDGESGQPVALWEGLTKSGPQQVRFDLISAGDRLVAVVRDKNESRVLDPVSGELIRSFPSIGDWSTAGPAPNGKSVAVLHRDFGAQGFVGAFRIWNLDKERWTELGPCSGQPAFNNPIRFSTDSKRVAYYLTDGSVWVWDVGAAKLLLQLPPTGQQFSEAVALSPDGKLLAREDQKTTKIQMWDVDTGKELPKLADQPERLGQFLAFSPDGKTLVGATNVNVLRIWDVAARKKLRDIQSHDFQVFQAAFTGDGKRLFVADGSRVSVWDPATGKPLDDTGGHRYVIHDATWSPDGARIVSGASYTDRVARVWDPTTGRKVLDLVGHTSGVESVAYSPDGTLLATGSQDGTVRLWEPATGKELHSFAAKDGMVRGLVFTPDGKSLVSGGAKALHVWDVAGRKEARRIPHAGGFVVQLTFLRNSGRLLVRGGAPGIRVIDFETGKEELRLAEKWSGRAAVSPDERYLALSDKDGTVGLADASTGRELRILVGPGPKETGERSSPVLGFSPDGRTLAAAFGPGDVRVYEVATGTERFRFTGHISAPWGVRFSPDGTRLCTFATDRTLLIWDVTGERLAPAPAPNNVDAAWTDLAVLDARKGFAAIRYLSADSAAALKLITDRVKPSAPVDPKIVTGLIAKLGSSDFTERERASKELTELALSAAMQLRDAAEKSDVPEVRTRLNAVLKETRLSGEHLRAFRAAEVLERIGTPEAQKVLTRLATGDPDFVLTRDAAGALSRLKSKRGAPSVR